MALVGMEDRMERLQEVSQALFAENARQEAVFAASRARKVLDIFLGWLCTAPMERTGDEFCAVTNSDHTSRVLLGNGRSFKGLRVAVQGNKEAKRKVHRVFAFTPELWLQVSARHYPYNSYTVFAEDLVPVRVGFLRKVDRIVNQACALALRLGFDDAKVSLKCPDHDTMKRFPKWEDQHFRLIRGMPYTTDYAHTFERWVLAPDRRNQFVVADLLGVPRPYSYPQAPVKRPRPAQTPEGDDYTDEEESPAGDSTDDSCVRCGRCKRRFDRFDNPRNFTMEIVLGEENVLCDPPCDSGPGVCTECGKHKPSRSNGICRMCYCGITEADLQ